MADLEARVSQLNATLLELSASVSRLASPIAIPGAVDINTGGNAGSASRALHKRRCMFETFEPPRARCANAGFTLTSAYLVGSL